MARTRRLTTDADLQEAMDRRTPVRVFEDDMIVGSAGTVIRFDDSTVVVQSGVSQIAYHDRRRCEFFENDRR